MVDKMRYIFRIADFMTEALARVAMCLLILLTMTVLYEVMMRYAFSSPTLWVFDVSYMLNGTLFYLAIAHALKYDVHVRIDFLSQLLPARTQSIILGLVLLLAVFPIFVLLTNVAIGRAVTAYATGAVEPVSNWAPRMWPFYSGIAAGLLVFTLQVLAKGVRYCAPSVDRPPQLDGT